MRMPEVGAGCLHNCSLLLYLREDTGTEAHQLSIDWLASTALDSSYPHFPATGITWVLGIQTQVPRLEWEIVY